MSNDKQNQNGKGKVIDLEQLNAQQAREKEMMDLLSSFQVADQFKAFTKLYHEGKPMPARQYAQLKKAFYCGAGQMQNLLANMSKLTPEECDKVFNDMVNQIQDYLEEQAKKYG